MKSTHAAQLAALTRATDALLADVAALPDPNRPAPDGGWSGVQVIRHLIGSEGGIITLLEKQLQKAAPTLPKATLRTWLNGWLLSLALRRRGQRFKAPARLQPPPANPADLAALRTEWATLRARLHALLAAFPATHHGRNVFNHPRAGWLNLTQTMRFMADHVRHHREQVARLGN